jgi:hypothetical protein
MKNYFGKKTILSTAGALLLLCVCISCGELTDGKFEDAVGGYSRPDPTNPDQPSGPEPESVIGQRGPAGGWIFYDKGVYSGGWRYLEAAPSELEFSAQWGAYGYNVSGTGLAVGSGKRNTEIIVAYLQNIGETGKAAQLCDSLSYDGYNDWFMPSKDDLNLMYTNLKQRGLGEFSNSWYWSSSQSSAYYSWHQRFNGGAQTGDYNYYKNTDLSVRAVRAY